jgi:hypothetical protein
MQLLGTPTASASIEVDAPPAVVWAVVSDITRTPEWSPVCHRCEWVDGFDGPVEGARFRGHNRLNGARWSRDCVVTAADPGRVFAFSTEFKGAESTRWRYDVESSGSGTHLTESYEVVAYPRWVRVFRSLPGAAAKSERDTRLNIDTSLGRIKALAERDR